MCCNPSLIDRRTDVRITRCFSQLVIVSSLVEALCYIKADVAESLLSRELRRRGRIMILLGLRESHTFLIPSRCSVYVSWARAAACSI
jgi:hypothetical protein